jgi:hypothetical protein
MVDVPAISNVSLAARYIYISFFISSKASRIKYTRTMRAQLVVAPMSHLAGLIYQCTTILLRLWPVYLFLLVCGVRPVWCLAVGRLSLYR